MYLQIVTYEELVAAFSREEKIRGKKSVKSCFSKVDLLFILPAGCRFCFN